MWEARLRELLRDRLLATVDSEAIKRHAEAVAEKKEDPFQALDELLDGLVLSWAHRSGH